MKMRCAFALSSTVFLMRQPGPASTKREVDFELFSLHSKATKSSLDFLFTVLQ